MSSTVFIIFIYACIVGSVLIVKGGKNDDNGCFIQLNEDSTLSGFYINYPNQKQIQTPVPYPWYVHGMQTQSLTLCHVLIILGLYV